MKFTLDYTNMIARQLGYRGNLHEFWLGMNFESENGNVKPRRWPRFSMTWRAERRDALRVTPVTRLRVAFGRRRAHHCGPRESVA